MNISHHQRTLPSFLMVGALGFLVDGAILTALLEATTLAPWQARIFSFLPAVAVTWLLNRRHTFAGRGFDRTAVEAVSYAVIQTLGATINISVFLIALMVAPSLRSIPVVPLAIGSGVAMLFNYMASSRVIYSRRRTQSAPRRNGANPLM